MAAPMRPADLERIYGEVIERSLAMRSLQDDGRTAFARERLREGARALGYLTRRYPGEIRDALVVDVGGGNGGFLLQFAAAGLRCATVDLDVNEELLALRRRVAVPLHQIAADARELPLKSGSARLVLSIEAMEHIPQPSRAGGEIARVLARGGICYVTTPPRLRYLFAPDPHYGIRGLAALPMPLQRFLFARLRPAERFEVEHLFWSAWGVVRTMPGVRIVEITSRNWAGPLRRLDWDWIVARKE
jgi:SAM-dependent methyltransferase